MNSEIRYKRSLAANTPYIWLIVSQWFMNFELWPLRIKLGGVGQNDIFEYLEQEMSYFGEGGGTDSFTIMCRSTNNFKCQTENWFEWIRRSLLHAFQTTVFLYIQSNQRIMIILIIQFWLNISNNIEIGQFDAWAWVHSPVSAFTHYTYVQYRVSFAGNASRQDNDQLAEPKRKQHILICLFSTSSSSTSYVRFICAGWRWNVFHWDRNDTRLLLYIHYFDCGLPGRLCGSVLKVQCTHTYPVSVTHNNNIQCLSIGLQAHPSYRICVYKIIHLKPQLTHTGNCLLCPFRERHERFSQFSTVGQMPLCTLFYQWESRIVT